VTSTWGQRRRTRGAGRLEECLAGFRKGLPDLCCGVNSEGASPVSVSVPCTPGGSREKRPGTREADRGTACSRVGPRRGSSIRPPGHRSSDPPRTKVEVPKGTINGKMPPGRRAPGGAVFVARFGLRRALRRDAEAHAGNIIATGALECENSWLGRPSSEESWPTPGPAIFFDPRTVTRPRPLSIRPVLKVVRSVSAGGDQGWPIRSQQRTVLHTPGPAGNSSLGRPAHTDREVRISGPEGRIGVSSGPHPGPPSSIRRRKPGSRPGSDAPRCSFGSVHDPAPSDSSVRRDLR